MLNTMFNVPKISGKNPIRENSFSNGTRKKILRGIFLLAIAVALIAWLPKPARAERNFLTSGRMKSSKSETSQSYAQKKVTGRDEIVWEYSVGLSAPWDAVRLDNGNTLITDCNNNRVIEVTPEGTIVWEYNSGLDYPADAERLANGNTLITDYSFVTEVTTEGTIVWQYPCGDGWDAERLVNGNTLIANGNQVIEVTPEGTIVWEYSSGYSEDAKRLPSGNTLIADYGNDRVIEVTSDGTIVWEYSTGLNGPCGVVRLPSGNTLIADFHGHRVIEVIPDGTIVWEYSNASSLSNAERLTNGNTLITDEGNNRVIEVGTAGIIGDFNSDGYVDATDLQMFGDHWHFVSTDPGWDAIYDLVQDNIIDAADLQVFGDHWHEGTPPKSGSGGKSGKGPNEFAGIVFDLDATTSGNQNLTSIPSQPAGTYIPVDVYCTGVSNLDTYEFEVIYDPTELSYISSSATNPITFEPNILTTNGGEALGWMVDSSTPGVLSIAYTLAGDDPAEAPEGEGLIADIVFQALVNTHGTLSFGDVYFYDSYGVVDLITDTGTATLPVELAAFTATYVAENGYTSIYWATASETDVNGFNIYRNTDDDFGTATKINADLISGHGTTSEPKEYSFIDDNPVVFETTYYYWLESIDFGGETHVYASISLTPEEGEGGFVNEFDKNMLTNYPNPFSGSTTIEYGIKGRLKAEPVEIRIYNVAGQLIETIKAKNGKAKWNVDNLPTGVYFYQLKTENYNEVKKMLLVQ